jgi:hypothetical protein
VHEEDDIFFANKSDNRSAVLVATGPRLCRERGEDARALFACKVDAVVKPVLCCGFFVIKFSQVSDAVGDNRCPVFPGSSNGVGGFLAKVVRPRELDGGAFGRNIEIIGSP